TETDITIRAESMRKLKRQLAELIAERSGQSVDRITEDSDRDRWFDPDEAVEYGLIDSVINRASGVGNSSNGTSA
ncbi:MAG: ATP-dependent Clp protease proteolytic subunit, partial [Marmoricola sp.]|nr:ATP-dependent Clp protease proteolytic subunit [Marmoricola sp.]